MPDWTDQPTETPLAWDGSLPTGGVFLADLSFSQAPDGFSIPKQALIISRANYPELIVVTFPGSDGPLVHGYLRDHLASMGFLITAQSADSILMESPAWQGAFTMTPDRAGLTLRRQV